MNHITTQDIESQEIGTTVTIKSKVRLGSQGSISKKLQKGGVTEIRELKALGEENFCNSKA